MKKYIVYLLLFCSLFSLCSLVAYADIDSGKNSYTSKEVEMKTSTRKLFSDYLTWQRIFVVETLAGAQDVSKAQVRLQQSQDAISGIFTTYYGEPTGPQMTNLFNQYNVLMVDYMNTAKIHGDKTMIINKIYDKIDEISGLLSMANINWSSNDISTMLKKYSDSFLNEIDFQANSIGSIDAKLFDTTFDQCMQMADTFSSGIVKQHFSKFW